MRTITREVREYDDPEYGHFFTVMETTTLHVVTGDEYETVELPPAFETRAEALEFIRECSGLACCAVCGYPYRGAACDNPACEATVGA